MLFSKENLKKLLHWVSISFFGLLVLALFYAAYLYYDINNVKERVAKIVALNAAAQQLRQSVSDAILGQRGAGSQNKLKPNVLLEAQQKTQLETDVQYFRDLSQKTKIYALENKWVNIRTTLLDADAFVEEVDNLLASVYSVTRLKAQLQAVLESELSSEFKDIAHSVSLFMLFEYHGLHEGGAASTARFNQYIQKVGYKLTQIPGASEDLKIYTLYTALERINCQLKCLNNVINHRFLYSIEKQQIYWSDRVLTLLFNANIVFLLLFLLCIVQMFIKHKIRLKMWIPSAAIHIENSPPLYSVEKEETSKQGETPDTFDLIFQSDILIEQLDGQIQEIMIVLNLFVTEHQKDGILLKKYIQMNELEKAVALTHQLMGVSCSIGAFALSHACKKLNRCFREGKSIDEDAQMQFETLLRLTFERVQEEINLFVIKIGS